MMEATFTTILFIVLGVDSPVALEVEFEVLSVTPFPFRVVSEWT